MKRLITLGRLLAVATAMSAAPAFSQTTASVDSLAQRLAALEQQNTELREELKQLRQELESLKPAERLDRLEETLEVQAGRVSEQDQVKVESTERVPIRITGMALFNYYRNSRHANFQVDYPGTALIPAGPVNSGANMRQSVFGLDFQSPQGLFGARYSGNILFDLNGQGSNAAVAPYLLRLRSGYVEAQWKRRGFLIGQEKVIFSPRDPNSLAQAASGPLLAAGNLYGLRPQVRYEERIPIGAAQELRARIGIVQTQEDYPNSIQTEFLPSLEIRRPSVEGHVQFRHTIDGPRRIEAGFGFHKSSTHVAATSIPSTVVSVDWFLNPIARFEISGFAFTGKSISLSGRRMPFFTVVRPAPDIVRVIPIRSQGGWIQVALLVTPRLTVNLMGGYEDPRDEDLVLPGLIARNSAKVINTFYRIAPNVIVGAEVAQMLTRYRAGEYPHTNHYNSYLAFLF